MEMEGSFIMLAVGHRQRLSGGVKAPQTQSFGPKVSIKYKIKP